MQVEPPTHSGTERRLLELVGDVCGLLDLDELRLGAARCDLPGAPVRLRLAERNRPGAGRCGGSHEASGEPEKFELWARYAHENPLLQYYQRTQNGLAVRFSDFVTVDELHALKLYQEVYGPMGVEHELAFTLPGGTGQILAIALSRGDRDYSDEERDFANAGRPFMIQAYLNAIAFQASRADSSSELRTPLLEALIGAGLMPREAEPLRLVALGRSNHDVARTLGISDRTVGKHLERAFRKLGVADRSSAAARVRLAGPGGEAA